VCRGFFVFLPHLGSNGGERWLRAGNAGKVRNLPAKKGNRGGNLKIQRENNPKERITEGRRKLQGTSRPHDRVKWRGEGDKHCPPKRGRGRSQETSSEKVLSCGGREEDYSEEGTIQWKGALIASSNFQEKSHENSVGTRMGS